ncbi:hypothetical protein Goshw_027753 [Gossypium schwendimanii]|uniref:Reverse transcriptase zinc-binding domain-containing protein n=1 Tax=Gossypium schwendimanii TaxID=34291 RepID=A0A7J9MEP0_GOSSC|nr:hypothetical protein [Gossypium schwendimanii]
MLVERRSRQGLRSARGNAGVKNKAKFRKESLSSRFLALKEVRETSDNHAVSAGDSLSVKGVGINSKGVVGFSTKEMNDLGRPDVGIAVKPAKGKLGKIMEKRPLISNATTQISNEDFNIDNFVSNSNLNFGVAGSSHHFSSAKDMVLDNVVCGDLSNEVQGDLNARIFENIKAHFNPAFEGSGGTFVPISDGVLDPRKHSTISFKDTSYKKEKSSSISLSWRRLGDRISISKERNGGRDLNGRSSRKASNALCGRGSHFKASENFRVPLAESIKEKAKFISNLNISNDLNSDSDAVALIPDGDTGCASDKFPRIFGEYNREYSLDIISLLKTRVSGSKADNIIAKLGFPCSHRVKAIGFSRDIWIGWKNSVRLEIIYNHSQYILARVRSTSSSILVFISFVYGSPNRQKRKDLWDILKCSIPMGNYPWVAIGDFNAILSSSEKSGGWVEHPDFGKFVEDNWGFSGDMLATLGCCLNDMVNEDGSWNLDLFRLWLPEEVIELIMGIPPSLLPEGPDKITWCHTSSKNFSVKSAYKICNGDDWNSNDEKRKCVWKTLGPQRVRFFIWLVLKQCLLSNVERVIRGLVVDPSSSICGFPSEDILHILRDCNATNSREIVNNALCWATQCYSPSRVTPSGDFGLPLEEQAYGSKIFLNTDRAVRLDTGNASVGGLREIGMDSGSLVLIDILESARFLKINFGAFFEGIKLVQRRGHDCVIILSDSLDVVQAIQGSFSATSNSALIR